MTNIHAFPTHSDGEAVRRLTERLLASFEAGEDLGSRAPHIHALAETLERTLIDLNREVEGLNESLTQSEVKLLMQCTDFPDVRDKLKQLVANARIFPNVEYK